MALDGYESRSATPLVRSGTGILTSSLARSESTLLNFPGTQHLIISLQMDYETDTDFLTTAQGITLRQNLLPSNLHILRIVD